MSDELPICPGCKCRKTTEQTINVQSKILEYFDFEPKLVGFMYNGNVDQAYDYFTSYNNRWACDSCLDIGIAIPGEAKEQTFCIWQPHFAYVDQKRQCRTCEESFVFSKEEQKFWYETLKFWVVSDAVNCKKCRKEKRNRKERIRDAQLEIEEFLPEFDKMNINHLEKVIHLYELTESKNVVNQYRQRLKKLRKNEES